MTVTQKLERDIEKLAEGLATSYEEINLLYKVLESVGHGDGIEQLVSITMDWLFDVLPASGILLQLPSLPTTSALFAAGQSRLILRGSSPLDDAEFARLIDSISGHIKEKPLVANRASREIGDRYPDLLQAFPEINEIVAAPVGATGRAGGWLAAFNHSDGLWFGTVEARLISAVARILGIHSENSELDRQRTQLLKTNQTAEKRIDKLQRELDELSGGLAWACDEVSRAYESMHMLHHLSEQITATESAEQHARAAVDSLIKALPIQGVAVQFVGQNAEWTELEEVDKLMITRGDFPITSESLDKLWENLRTDDSGKPLIINRNGDAASNLVNQLIVVPFFSNGKRIGRLVALNHVRNEELGSVEAGLMAAVGELIALRHAFSSN